MLKISDGRRHFWQWDLHQKLLVEYENVCHVHFEDPDGNVALTVETYELDGEKVADVPNILLQKSQTIHAYVYKCEGDECTIKHTYFNVYERQRPADYVYTETEVKRWETLEERIAALEQGGADGFSPTVDIEPIDGGHRISITDKDGTQTADVMDGKDGAGGSGGASVQSDWSVNDENDPAYVQNRTHWVDVFPDIEIEAGYTSMDSFDASALGFGRFDKISDAAWPKGKCLQARIRPNDFPDTYGGANELFSMDGVTAFSLGGWGDTQYFVSAEKAVDLSAVAGFSIPSIGMYIMQTNWYGLQKITLTCPDTYHEIDERFMPETVTRKSYVDSLEDIYMGYELSLRVDGEVFVNGNYGSDVMESDTDTSRFSSGKGIATVSLDDRAPREVVFSLQKTGGQYSGTGIISLEGKIIGVFVEFVPFYGEEFRACAKTLCANGDSEIILTSPSGTRYRLTVADDGTLTTAAM